MDQMTAGRRHGLDAIIRGAMARDRLSQAALASEVGLSRGQLSGRLNGRTRWAVGELRATAEVLELDPYELFDLAAQDQPATSRGEVA